MHAIRIVYRVRIIGGELRDEVDGSTDTCAWFTPTRRPAAPGQPRPVGPFGSRGRPARRLTMHSTIAIDVSAPAELVFGSPAT